MTIREDFQRAIAQSQQGKSAVGSATVASRNHSTLFSSWLTKTVGSSIASYDLKKTGPGFNVTDENIESAIAERPIFFIGLSITLKLRSYYLGDSRKPDDIALKLLSKLSPIVNPIFIAGKPLDIAAAVGLVRQFHNYTPHWTSTGMLAFSAPHKKTISLRFQFDYTGGVGFCQAKDFSASNPSPKEFMGAYFQIYREPTTAAVTQKYIEDFAHNWLPPSSIMRDGAEDKTEKGISQVFRFITIPVSALDNDTEMFKSVLKNLLKW